MELLYEDDTDKTNSSIKATERFVRIEMETNKVCLTINEDKTQYMRVNRTVGRDRISRNIITMERYTF